MKHATYTRTVKPLRHAIHLEQCPHCGAPAHHYCRDVDGSTMVHHAHEARAVARVLSRTARSAERIGARAGVYFSPTPSRRHH